MLPAELTAYYIGARARALRKHQERRDEAYAAMPRLPQIEAEMKETAFGLGIGLRAVSDKAAYRQSIGEALASLSMERARLLADHGLPIDYLDIPYECSRCEDTGSLPDGTLCPCARARLLQLKYASSGLAEDARFELFRTNVYKNAEQKKRSLRARELCELYAGELALNGAPGLVLMGETGVGKTYLLDCIGRRAIERGRSVEKYTAYNIVDLMLRSVRERTSAVDLTAPELLLIDDLGTEPMIPSITFEALFAVINERGNAGRATAIATNLDRAGILDGYGERIFSRLFSQRGYSVIELKGSDLRVG